MGVMSKYELEQQTRRSGSLSGDKRVLELEAELATRENEIESLNQQLKQATSRIAAYEVHFFFFVFHLFSLCQ